MKQIYSYLKANNQTLAVAESCTGGGLANAITVIPGISEVFFGGVVAYTDKAKIDILKIDASVIKIHGAESEEMAKLMAIQAKKIFNTTWALSTTGISGPTTHSDLPLGVVYIGLCGPSITKVFKHDFKNLTRLQHRRKTIKNALMHLIEEWTI